MDEPNTKSMFEYLGRVHQKLWLIYYFDDNEPLSFVQIADSERQDHFRSPTYPHSGTHITLTL